MEIKGRRRTGTRRRRSPCRASGAGLEQNRNQNNEGHGQHLHVARPPEPGLFSIAVERPHRQLVRLQDVWKRWRPNSAISNQELLIGVREDNREPLFISPGIAHAPHTLIAGSTGSGKSVLMQSLILGIAATNTPVYARIV